MRYKVERRELGFGPEFENCRPQGIQTYCVHLLLSAQKGFSFFFFKIIIIIFKTNSDFFFLLPHRYLG